MEVPRTWRPVRVSSPCGTLEEDEGHSRSRAEEGVYSVYLQAGGWALAPVVERTFIGGRWTPDAYRTGEPAPPPRRRTPIYAANGRNYENLFLPLSVAVTGARPVTLGRCEVPRRNGVVHAGHLLLRTQMFLFLPLPHPFPPVPTNLVRSNIKAATNVARPQPRTPLLCRQSHRNALLTD